MVCGMENKQMNEHYFEQWLDDVKQIAGDKYSDLEQHYSFREAYADFRLKSDEAVEDAVRYCREYVE